VRKLNLLTIIVPVYNEAPNLPLLYKAIIASLNQLSYDFELIFIDDGSSDESPKALRELAENDDRLTVIEFARNFGKEEAVSAGLHTASGDAAVVLDADLQHPPELIGKFIEKWQRGANVVVGVRREDGKESWFKKFSSNVFYRIMNTISSTEVVPHATDFRLLDKRALKAFRRFTEHNRITRGLIDWMGFRRSYVYFNAPPRAKGEASYSYPKLIKLAVNSFTSLSLVPLKFAGYLGAFILAISVALGVVVLGAELLGDPYNWQISGTAMLAILTLFLVGVILVCLGLVSLYIARIHDEVTNRPLYITKTKKVGNGGKKS
jgi:polyisoprenyl-phosphate glycosyltransferase